MKHLIAVLAAMLITCALVTGALADAAIVSGAAQTDVPATETADAVVSMLSVFQDDAQSLYDVHEEKPDQLTVDTLLDIFAFVMEEGNRPARYFPEETQEQISEAIDGGDVDSLYMTEFMRLSLADTPVREDVRIQMILDVDYLVGQTVVVVVADTSDPDNLVWVALEAEVTTDSLVEFVIPQNLLASLKGEHVLYSLLTTRYGMTRYYLQEEEIVVPNPWPSISAKDTSYIEQTLVAEEIEIEIEFELIIVDETAEQIDELLMLRDYVKTQHHPLVDWFPQDVVEEMRLLMGEEVELDTLVVYDALSLQSVNYQDTYGDVVAAFRFATPYEQDQHVVAMLGIPREGEGTQLTTMDWALELVWVQEGGVIEITFDQLVMIEMGEQPGLLLLLAEPLT